MRILVVEDFAPMRGTLERALRGAGFAVDGASDGEEALYHLKEAVHDVVILDLMLPQVDGLTVLRRMRAAANPAHVLVLTARDAVDDRVAALDLGADDYLVKPFALTELLARVRALVRRAYARKDPVLRIADLEIDTASRTARRGGQTLDLTAREFALLEYLALRTGEVVPRGDLLERLYQLEDAATSNVLEVHVSNLRRKLEEQGAERLLHTRRGEGYLLAVPAGSA
ncbi:MAG: response regulator transcription factor [Chloroflexi bacterium]|nr:response regulator transcription factor [Chloroflexota bacterium]